MDAGRGFVIRLEMGVGGKRAKHREGRAGDWFLPPFRSCNAQTEAGGSTEIAGSPNGSKSSVSREWRPIPLTLPSPHRGEGRGEGINTNPSISFPGVSVKSNILLSNLMCKIS